MNLHTVSETVKVAGQIQETEPLETIRLEQVGVRYRIPSERIGTFKEYMIRRIQRKVQHREFWALQDIDVGVHKGKEFGLIGHDGPGKSTFLALVARVLRPRAGRVVLRG